jgi:hypothetical protein
MLQLYQVLNQVYQFHTQGELLNLGLPRLDRLWDTSASKPVPLQESGP